MLELIAIIGKFLCQPYLFTIILIVGFLGINEKIYGRTLFLLTFTMIYNVYLKSRFHMPLPPPLEGWAFPSGHMHSAVVFWGGLALEYRKVWITEIVVFILCLCGYALIYHGYHYPIDILGAVGFGMLSLVLYQLLKQMKFFEKPYRLGLLLTLLGAGIILLMMPESRKTHVWQAFGALIGFSIGWWLLQKQSDFIFSLKQKALLLAIAIVITLGLMWGVNQFGFSLKLSNFIACLLISFWISTCKIAVKQLFVARPSRQA